MRVKKFLAAVLVFGLVVGLLSFPRAAATVLTPPTINLAERFVDYDLHSSAPIRVIVQFAGEPWAVVKNNLQAQGITEMSALQEIHLRELAAQRDHIVAAMHNAGIAALVEHSYSTVYHGVAVTVPANQVTRLLQVSGVVDVHPDIELHAQGLQHSLPAIGAPQAWALPPGLDGAGILVAVLDTGADYMHPDLGGGMGPGFKVVGGWDFVDDDADPMEQKNMPGVDPATGRDWNTAHGTHVAATVVAVAPAANLYILRVLGRGGGGSSADVMAGIERAVRAGAHVANMSLGAALGHPESPWAVAVDNAVRAGVVFTVSAGNSGSLERTIGTYANTRLAIAVGWADTNPKPLVLPRGAARPFVGTMMTFSPPLVALGTGELEFVDVGLGNVAADFVNPDGTSRVVGRIALMQRGGATFAVKSRNARNAGAVGAIVWNNVPGGFGGTLGSIEPNDIPSLTLSQEDGAALRALPVGSRFISLSLGAHHLMSPSSSRGPTALLDIAPHVSAPGEAITAAYPFPGTDGSHVGGAFQKVPGAGNPWFGTISGTSMAAPHAAGAAALMLQANPAWTPATIRLALMNTAQDIKRVDGLSFRPIDQGAGMINIHRALTAGLRIDPGMLNFREVASGETRRILMVQSLVASNAVFRTRVEKFNPGHAYQLLLPSYVPVGAGASLGVPVALFVDPSLPASVPNTSDFGGFIIFENVANPLDYYRVPFQFFNRLPISQLRASPDAFSPNGDGVLDTVTISLVAGQPIHAVRFTAIADPVAGGAGAHLVIATVGPLSPGAHSFVWNGSVLPGWTLREGFNQVHAQWQVAPGGPWVGGFSATPVISPAFARLSVDNTPPEFQFVAPIINPTRPNSVLVRGNVNDFLIVNAMSAGGSIWVNDVLQELSSQNIPGLPGANLVQFQSQSLDVNLNETSIVRLRARDAAGNETRASFNLTGIALDSLPTHTAAETIIVTGRVVQGMALTINGAPIAIGPLGAFSADVPLQLGTNTLIFAASVPAWGSAMSPVVRVLEVARGQQAASLSPSATSIQVDGSVTVDIRVENVVDLYGADLVVTFDPNLVQVVDADPALAGVQIHSGTALESLGQVTDAQNTVDNGTGVIRLSRALLGVTAGFSGSGVLGRIEFRAVGAGMFVPAVTRLTAVSGQALPIDLSIGSATPVQITPAPTTLALRSTTVSGLFNTTYRQEIVVTAAAGIRAATLRIRFDPQLVQVVDADPMQAGVQIHKGSALESVGAVTYTVNSADNATGTISISSELAAGAATFAGSGVLGSIEFRVVGSGAAAPTIWEANLVSGAGVAAHFAVGATDAVIVGPGTVSGVVQLPGRQVLVAGESRPRYGGVVVTVAGIQATTNDAGEFVVSGVPVGTFPIVARVAGYLASVGQVTISSVNPNAVSNMLLLSGDINGDGRIDILDVVIVSQALGNAVGDPRFDARADVNADGKIDIIDLVATTRNIGRP